MGNLVDGIFTKIEVSPFGDKIIDLFTQNEFDKCILFYNNFKNVITQIPQAQQIVPTEINSSEKKVLFNKFFYGI